MEFAGCTDAGPRSVNEDNFFYQSLSRFGNISHGISGFILVSDGMGGYSAGDVASGLVVEVAKTYLSCLKDMSHETGALELDPKMALIELARNANKAISDEIAARGGKSMGATFVGAFVSPHRVWIGHVGDSRAYLIRNNEATQLTADHSAVGRLLQKGVITEKEAQNHPERNKIEKALGFTFDDPEIDVVDLEAGDVIMLCSDGVSTVLDSRGICDCFHRSRNLKDAAETLLSTALKTTDDNATLVLWDSLGKYRDSSTYRKQNATQVMPNMFIPASASGGASPSFRSQEPKMRHRGESSTGAAKGLTLSPRLIALIVAIVAILVGVAFGLGKCGSSDGGGGGGEPAATQQGTEGQQATTEGESETSENASTQEASGSAKLKLASSADLYYRDTAGKVYLMDESVGAPFKLCIDPGNTISYSNKPEEYQGKQYFVLDDSYLKELRRDYLNTGTEQQSELEVFLGTNPGTAKPVYDELLKGLQSKKIDPNTFQALLVTADVS